VGASEKNMFVIRGGDLPANFRLFELVGNEYFLNFVDGMKGRVALPTGLSELEVLKGQAKRNGGTYQVRLTDDSRGKITIGDTTFLFQFVAPPPIQPRPQLPVSVTRGATGIDWPTTVIAAFSFLIHFCAIGAMYSDWLDPVVDYEVNVGALVETVKSLPAPPPVEEPKEQAPAEEKAAEPEPAPKQQAPQEKPEPSQQPGKQHISKAAAAALSNELESLEMATLAALSGTGPATANVLRSGEVPTSALDAAAASEAGVSAGDSGGLKLGGSGGTIRPGAAGGGLASIGTSGKSTAGGSGGQVEVKGPRGDAAVGGPNVAGGNVSNASRVVAGMRAGFRACYNRGLSANPDIQGKIMLKIKVGPTGQVADVTSTTTGDLPPAVVTCVEQRAKAASFSAPEGGVAVVQVPVSFVKQ
jgi:outer membrane biosynthesis protein TonB